MRYELRGVTISSYQISGAGADSPLPREEVTMTYTPIEVSYSRDELGFSSSDDGVEKTEFQWIEIKAAPKPAVQPLADDLDDLILVERHDLDPFSGLLLPAVQAASFMADDGETTAALWDDFVFS